MPIPRPLFPFLSSGRRTARYCSSTSVPAARSAPQPATPRLPSAAATAPPAHLVRSSPWPSPPWPLKGPLHPALSRRSGFRTASTSHGGQGQWRRTPTPSTTPRRESVCMEHATKKRKNGNGDLHPAIPWGRGIAIPGTASDARPIPQPPCYDPRGYGARPPPPTDDGHASSLSHEGTRRSGSFTSCGAPWTSAQTDTCVVSGPPPPPPPPPPDSPRTRYIFPNGSMMVAYVVRCGKPCNNSNGIAWTDHWASGVWRPMAAGADGFKQQLVPAPGTGRAEDPFLCECKAVQRHCVTYVLI